MEKLIGSKNIELSIQLKRALTDELSEDSEVFVAQALSGG